MLSFEEHASYIETGMVDPGVALGSCSACSIQIEASPVFKHTGSPSACGVALSYVRSQFVVVCPKAIATMR